MLARMTRTGWLQKNKSGRYRLTAAGRRALAEVRARLAELQIEVFRPRPKAAKPPRP
jgi:Mn-dependent DtxR family transcriptional regulator